jgi:hypothetical protein
VNGIARLSLGKAADIEAECTKNLVQNLALPDGFALFTFEHSIAKSNILQGENSLRWASNSLQINNVDARSRLAA